MEGNKVCPDCGSRQINQDSNYGETMWDCANCGLRFPDRKAGLVNEKFKLGGSDGLHLIDSEGRTRAYFGWSKTRGCSMRIESGLQYALIQRIVELLNADNTVGTIEMEEGRCGTYVPVTGRKE